MNKPLPIAALVFAAILIAGCTLKKAMPQYSADQSRRANERAAESMKLTQQTARGNGR